jgi:SAM-dependent methyltransferase
MQIISSGDVDNCFNLRETEMVFSQYAHFYDLYYAEKNYSAEVDFILQLAARFGTEPKTVLDMGCGTGRHMEEFCKRGMGCDGFDLSPEMLEQARQRLVEKDCTLAEGNLTNFENGKQYDLVVAMFAVMGYLTENDQMLAGLNTARKHLKPGGVFIFDGWFGPAVLAQQPEKRLHQYCDGDDIVERKAVPSLDPINQTVSIDYDITQKQKGIVTRQISEKHKMRFMFIKEMELAMNNAGLELVHCCPFMEPDKKLTTADWNISFAAHRKNIQEIV